MHQMCCSRINICMIALLTSSWAGLSQNTLRGKITDEKNGEPVPYANVFFTNTTLGAPTIEDGTFEIRNIPNGKYDLTISMIGYKRFQRVVELRDSTANIRIALKQSPENLAGVTVVADQADNKKYFSTFRKLFLGESRNARHSEILNPNEVHLFFDEDLKILTGHASKPIVVENRALGYRCIYILDRFELNFKTSTQSLLGVARFEELPAGDRKDSLRRENRRLVAYRGSLNHFVRSLFANKLEQEKFRVVSVTINPNTATGPAYKGVEYPINVAERLSGSTVKTFSFRGTLKVEYQGEEEEWEYRNAKTKSSNNQVSFLKFPKTTITLFENGYYTDPLGIYLEGYLAWSETIGERLPLSYYPPELGKDQK